MFLKSFRYSNKKGGVIIVNTDRIKGALLGLAWGDILGCPVEGWRAHEIRETYGVYENLPHTYPLDPISEKRRKKLRPPGLHSDDTQQAMALVLALLSGGWDRERWKRMLVRGMQEEAWRGIGRNFVAAVHRLRKGEDLKQSGSPSAGIGAAMRTGPVGAVFPRTEEREDRLIAVLESTLMTHSDQRAAVFAAVVAEAVSLFIQDRSREEVLRELPEFALLAEERARGLAEDGWKVEEADSRLVSEALREAAAWVDLPVEELRRRISEGARPHLAEGFTRAHPNQGFVLLGGLHALLMACRSDMKPQEILLSIIREGFDTDTVAAIAGSILGARFGCEWIPAERLVDGERILRYAEALVSQEAPETEKEFFRREAEWTAREREFQRGLRERNDA
jgi:ADP-ribosyl-[dinitrogen reductase] hydrolase